MKKILKNVGKIHMTYGPQESPEKALSVTYLVSSLLNGMGEQEKKDMLRGAKQNRKLFRNLKRVVKELGI